MARAGSVGGVALRCGSLGPATGMRLTGPPRDGGAANTPARAGPDFGDSGSCAGSTIGDSASRAACGFTSTFTGAGVASVRASTFAGAGVLSPRVASTFTGAGVTSRTGSTLTGGFASTFTGAGVTSLGLTSTFASGRGVVARGASGVRAEDRADTGGIVFGRSVSCIPAGRVPSFGRGGGPLRAALVPIGAGGGPTRVISAGPRAPISPLIGGGPFEDSGLGLVGAGATRVISSLRAVGRGGSGVARPGAWIGFEVAPPSVGYEAVDAVRRSSGVAGGPLLRAAWARRERLSSSPATAAGDSRRERLSSSPERAGAAGGVGACVGAGAAGAARLSSGTVAKPPVVARSARTGAGVVLSASASAIGPGRPRCVWSIVTSMIESSTSTSISAVPDSVTCKPVLIGRGVGSSGLPSLTPLRASRIRRSSARPSLVNSVRERRPFCSGRGSASRSTSTSSSSAARPCRLRGRIDSATGSVFGRGGASAAGGVGPLRTAGSSAPVRWRVAIPEPSGGRANIPVISSSPPCASASSRSWAITSCTTTRITLALGQRFSGSKARARSTSSITCRGRCGTTEAIERGGLRATAIRRSITGPVDGCTVSPDSARNIVAAIDHMSLRASRFWLSARACSGAMYETVPNTMPSL